MPKELMAYGGAAGGELKMWASMAKRIREFVRENNLTEMMLTHGMAGVKAVAKPAIAYGIKGGIKVDHIHLGDKIFLLNDAQWQKFSEMVLNDCKARLANAKSIGFEQTIKLADAVQSLR